jgi:hypothetical protein
MEAFDLAAFDQPLFFSVLKRSFFKKAATDPLQSCLRSRAALKYYGYRPYNIRPAWPLYANSSEMLSLSAASAERRARRGGSANVS